MQIPLVFLNGPWKLAMGLNALDPADWLWRDDTFAAETAQRLALLAERPAEVLTMLPKATPAAAELVAMVEAHQGLPPSDEGSLARLAGLVQEDFCVMQATPERTYALTAALLCAPAHWRLAEKLGRRMSEIHRPVPGFAKRLGGPADRFLANLMVERPVWRANWSVVESPVLFHPQPREPVPGITAENAGERLWLRVESQTLRRLPDSQAVVFIIRTLVRRLDEICADPVVARAMALRIGEMEPGMAGYKGMPALRGPLLGWLAGRG
jgi:dimethylamine monooxygenase subunit A